jgi:asparagine synthase (glutamine-hydrolysing)
MCGIAGIATLDGSPARERVKAMCDSILHRGPDGEGIFVAPGVGLGMRRLAIIDLNTGDQPVTNTSGTIIVVFNGEIYNYRELRQDLIDKGHSFRSSGDSEVIPHLYEEYGMDFIARMNGMFAIALWDSRERRLLLTRDRAGIKPLYYSLRNGTLFFGSEVKAILVAGGSNREINPRGVDQLLTFEYTASPTTLFRDVHKLPAGGWLVWTKGDLQQGRFWSLPTSVTMLDESEEAIAERVRTTVTAAVRRQLVSDVPIGAFLSGGIDSSIMVATMSEVSPTPPMTFSVGFGEASYSEVEYARVVAAHCGTQHHEEILSPDYLSILPEVVSQLDQPIADFSVFPTLLVARMARRRVTVALGGDGGDELFAGYDAYQADRYAHAALDWLPRSLRQALDKCAQLTPLGRDKRGVVNQLRRFLEGAALPSRWQHMRWMVFLSNRGREQLYSPEFQAAVAGQTGEIISEMLDGGSASRLDDQMRCDLRFYLPEDILAKVDMMSMASSLEARVPYLDNEVIDLALTIPAHLKVRGGVRKYILKKAFKDRLPASILGRGKEGFSMPMKNWLNQEWNGLMHDLLCADNLRADGLFDAAAVQRLMREHEARKQNHSHLLWGLMVFQLWKQRFQSCTT